MEATIEKLQKLHKSVQKLESVLQEIWSLVDDVESDPKFSELLKTAKTYQAKKQKSVAHLEELIEKLSEFDSCIDEIPEDGTAAVDLEDSISELIEWIHENKAKA
jgi:2-hydroxy-3-keto-5-methylthiopentenyl-1-phosphate phosphatase